MHRMKRVVRQVRRMAVPMIVRRHFDQVAVVNDLRRRVRLNGRFGDAKNVHAISPKS